MIDQSTRIRPAAVETWKLIDDGEIPNNPDLPLLLYRQSVTLPDADPAAVFEALFTANGWPAAWRNGIFPFHHFHSTAHEALGVFSGRATACFGGGSGVEITVSAGDVVVIPAGVGHKAVEASTDLGIVGAYPAGSSPDLCRGAPGERPRCVDAIARGGGTRSRSALRCRRTPAPVLVLNAGTRAVGPRPGTRTCPATVSTGRRP